MEIVAGLDHISLSYGFRFGLLRSRWLRLFPLFIDRLDQSRLLLLSERVVDATGGVENAENGGVSSHDQISKTSTIPTVYKSITQL